MESSIVQKPVFIVGCGRSGTTLLFDLLANHPGLARTTGYPDGEDHDGWVEHGQCVMAGIGNVAHSKYGDGINGYHCCLEMDRSDVTAEIVAAMHRHYSENVLGGNSAKRVINKCPHNSNKIDYMLGIFPDAKVVQIVRDCEPMVASWLAIMDAHPSLVAYWPEESLPCFWLLPKPKEPASVARLARHNRFFPGGGASLWIDYWNKVNQGIERQMVGRLDQLLIIRYEDLVSRPADVLGQIVKFCGLPEHSFETGHLRTDTAQRHTHLMTPDFSRLISELSQQVRASFCYISPSGESSRKKRLYVPEGRELA